MLRVVINHNFTFHQHRASSELQHLELRLSLPAFGGTWTPSFISSRSDEKLEPDYHEGTCGQEEGIATPWQYATLARRPDGSGTIFLKQ